MMICLLNRKHERLSNNSCLANGSRLLRFMPFLTFVLINILTNIYSTFRHNMLHNAQIHLISRNNSNKCDKCRRQNDS